MEVGGGVRYFLATRHKASEMGALSDFSSYFDQQARFCFSSFDERKVSFEVGEGLDIGIPRGIEFALEKMKVCSS